VTSKSAYSDIPLAAKDAKDMINFFQTAYGVPNEQIFYLPNTGIKEITKVYGDLAKRLKTNPLRRSLIMHIFAGHGVQLDG
jgi:hypothetical protein